ncbi:DNA repair protein XRCC4-like [Vanessa atalanta]|uniref:DNA repair protein XRCC4-like n=1 Tax=Vanessa atalanta TaxID=42275 RepID=UPI001FCD4B20|nr:DNA repair protein XRCC4-like [Vanessa atalanta]
MELEDAITVTKVNTHIGPLYILIGWQSKSFEIFIYQDDYVWKGKFSAHRLAGFSKNLQLPENEYIASIKRCLSEYREDYLYELKSGFFYWKRIQNESIIIEGFLPVELENSPNITRLDLIDISLALNRHLCNKVSNYKSKFENIQKEYQKCLNDTEEFLSLKVDMEKTLSKKFLNLLNLKKNEVVMLLKSSYKMQ